MATLTSKPRKTAKPPKPTKLCLHCNQVRNLSDFYSNRDWIEQAGKDIWCKKCISQIKTKDEMRKYFWENHREWKENIWEKAVKKASLIAAKNQKYQKLNEDMRSVVLETLACEQIPSLMQIAYNYVDNSKDINENSYEDAKENGKIVELSSVKPKDPNLKTYSHEFNGDFKPAELEYLEEYYAGLERDFDLSDTSLRDNAKKLAKASLLVDKVQNDYMAGRCSLQDVKDAIAQYDLLMKTGNFAACKRKPGDKGGMGSWAEICFQLETTGHTMQNKVEWEKDDVDRTIEEFRYIVESLGLDSL